MPYKCVLSDMVREDVQVVRVLLAYGRQLYNLQYKIYSTGDITRGDRMIDFIA